jgi:DNA sulfur modification protein DndE
MVFKLKTSKETMKIFEDLGARIHLQPFALCKIAIALSLRKEQLETDHFKTDGEGLELNRQTITGEYDDLFRALVISHACEPLTDEEYFPKYLKAHIDRGAKLLDSEYKYSNENFYNHMMDLDKGI